jgi:hypothetical protein
LAKWLLPLLLLLLLALRNRRLLLRGDYLMLTSAFCEGSCLGTEVPLHPVLLLLH